MPAYLHGLLGQKWVLSRGRCVINSLAVCKPGFQSSEGLETWANELGKELPCADSSDANVL